MRMISDLGPKHSKTNAFLFQIGPKSVEMYNRAQFSSVAQSCLTLCDPVNRSTPGLPVHHQLPEFTQTGVHRVGDATQPNDWQMDKQFYFHKFMNHGQLMLLTQICGSLWSLRLSREIHSTSLNIGTEYVFSGLRLGHAFCRSSSPRQQPSAPKNQRHLITKYPMLHVSVY